MEPSRRGKVDADPEQRGGCDDAVETDSLPGLVLKATLPAMGFSEGVSSRARQHRQGQETCADDSQAKKRKCKVAGNRS
jgi:hypothetical protein